MTPHRLLRHRAVPWSESNRLHLASGFRTRHAALLVGQPGLRLFCPRSKEPVETSAFFGSQLIPRFFPRGDLRGRSEIASEGTASSALLTPISKESRTRVFHTTPSLRRMTFEYKPFNLVTAKPIRVAVPPPAATARFCICHQTTFLQPSPARQA